MSSSALGVAAGVRLVALKAPILPTYVPSYVESIKRLFP